MDWLQPLLPRIESLGLLGYWLVFGASFAESLAFVGAFVPGVAVIMLAGFLSSTGYLDIGDLIWFAAAGAILGDGASYYLGTKGTRLFRPDSKLLKRGHLERGERFFREYGSKSIFLARFLGPLRAAVPFAAGLSRMPVRTFFVWNVASAIVWSTVLLLLGFFFGSAFAVLQVWSTRAGYVAGAILVLAALLYGMKVLVVRYGRGLAHFVGSVSRSVQIAVATNPDVRRLVERHPRFFGLIGRRIDRTQFTGLPLTLFVIGLAYVLALLLGVVGDVLSANIVVAADLRLANLLAYFRTPELTTASLWITLLGSLPVVLSTAIAASFAMWVWERRDYIPFLWLALAIDQAVAFLGKLAMHRPRPQNLIYIEPSFSFPSGHAMVSVVLYGFIAYALVRHTKGWGLRVNAFFAAVAIALLIGFSRLYLGEHFLSDVWAGYLVGALILVTIIALLEAGQWRRAQAEPRGRSGSPAAKWATVTLVAASVAFWAGWALLYPPALAEPTEPSIVEVQGDIGAYLANEPQLRYSETLLGNPAEPLGFIFLAKDDAALRRSFERASWYEADPVGFGSIAKITRAAFLRTAYANAPMTPAFWNTQVNDFGFEKPTSAGNVTERHHIRIWKTNLRQNGLRAYVGTASLDIGFKWLVTHRISPDIDTEKAFVEGDLGAAGAIESVKEIPFVPPVLGTNFAEDAFFTNGKLYVVVLK